jgi:uncharacterized membrane protein YdcZ (DUF606 family)
MRCRARSRTCNSPRPDRLIVFRVVVAAAALLLGGLVIAWMVTKDRRYLVIAGRIALWALAGGVLLGLLYVFERVLLM